MIHYYYSSCLFGLIIVVHFVVEWFGMTKAVVVNISALRGQMMLAWLFDKTVVGIRPHLLPLTVLTVMKGPRIVD